MSSESFDRCAEIEKLTPRQFDHMQRMVLTNIIEGILQTNHTPQEVAAGFWEKYQYHYDTVMEEKPEAINKVNELIDNAQNLKHIHKRQNADEMKQKIMVAVFHFQELFLVERDDAFYEEFREYILDTGLADKRLAELQKELDALNIVLDQSPLSIGAYDELSARVRFLQKHIQSGKQYIPRHQEVLLQDFLRRFPEAIECMKQFILCRQEGAPTYVFRDACIIILLDILRQHPKARMTKSETRKLVAELMTNCFQCKTSSKIVENIDLIVKNNSPNN